MSRECKLFSPAQSFDLASPALFGDRNSDLKALDGRDWDVCIDNPTTLPVWVRDAAHVLKGHVGQYAFISTISVYATSDKPADEAVPVLAYQGTEPMAETSGSLNANPRLYGPLKALSEKEAQTQYGETTTTIIRPKIPVTRRVNWAVRRGWHPTGIPPAAAISLRDDRAGAPPEPLAFQWLCS
jgi:hypothetical protein